MDRLSNRMSLCSVLRVESINERHLSSTTTPPHWGAGTGRVLHRALEASDGTANICYSLPEGF